jgi:hypothetical protein
MTGLRRHCRRRRGRANSEHQPAPRCQRPAPQQVRPSCAARTAPAGTAGPPWPPAAGRPGKPAARSQRPRRPAGARPANPGLIIQQQQRPRRAAPKVTGEERLPYGKSSVWRRRGRLAVLVGCRKAWPRGSCSQRHLLVAGGWGHHACRLGLEADAGGVGGR